MDDLRPKFTVIRGRKRLPIAPEVFRPNEESAQSTLFPEPRAGVVVFVCFPDVQEPEFVSVLEHARPSFVIDLRLVPRFDVGQLNRDRAFKLFDAAGTQYVDLTGMLVNGSSSEDVLAAFRDLVKDNRFDLRRPVVFLLSRRETSVAGDTEVLEALAASGKHAKEVVNVPCFA